MDETRQAALTERYSTSGCLDEMALLQAFYAASMGMDDDLTEDDFLWMYEHYKNCSSEDEVQSSEAEQRKVRVISITNGSVLRVMSCTDNACLASFPDSYDVHLAGVNTTEINPKLEAIGGQIVTIQDVEYNDDLGMMDVIVTKDNLNYNTLLANSSSGAGLDNVVYLNHYTMSPSELKPGEDSWIRADFKNNGARSKEKYYLGVVLTDRDGTKWTFENSEQYASIFEAGETKTLRLRFTVPTYMDTPIAFSLKLYKKK